MAPQTLQLIQILLAQFIPCFAQQRTFKYLAEFFVGFVMNGRKTITNIFLSTSRNRHYTNYYRFLKSYAWSQIDTAKTLFKLIEEKTASFLEKSGGGKENSFLVLDSTFAKKSGKKFDGVDFFFDHSSKPNTPKYVWGHCVFILGLLHRVSSLGWLCFPFLSFLYLRKETIKRQKLDTSFIPMIDKAVNAILSVKECLRKPTTVVADAFFSKKTFFKPLMDNGIFTLTRARKDAVAYEPAPLNIEKKRGRPKVFGKKVKLRELLETEPLSFMTAKVSGKIKTLGYLIKDLLVRGYSKPVRFLVIQDRTPVILMTTNLSLTAEEMLETYCARFQIEFSIRDLKQYLGFEEYQVRRSEAIEKFLNICVLVYSLLKITFVTRNSLQRLVRKKIDHPWRTKPSIFSFEQVLSAIRHEITIKQFFDTSALPPEQKKIPAIKNISERKDKLKC